MNQVRPEQKDADREDEKTERNIDQGHVKE
jgi:hypothetical protein